MSEENVEIYRRHVAAFNDDDLDAIADLITEDFEVHSLLGCGG